MELSTNANIPEPRKSGAEEIQLVVEKPLNAYAPTPSVVVRVLFGSIEQLIEPTLVETDIECPKGESLR